MKKNDGDKTKLSGKARFGKKAKSIAAALTLAAGTMGLTACGPSPDAGAEWNQSNERVPADLSNLSAAERGGSLVQGREACIDRMVQSGQARAEASTTCDEITRQAQQMVQSNPAQYNNGGAFNNALLWYMIGSNMGSSSRPVVYYGNPSGNLTQASGIRAGTAARTITPLQSEYLRAAPASRPGLAARMATRPGVNVVSVPVTAATRMTPPPPPPRATTSTGGMSSRGISSGS